MKKSMQDTVEWRECTSVGGGDMEWDPAELGFSLGCDTVSCEDSKIYLLLSTYYAPDPILIALHEEFLLVTLR